MTDDARSMLIGTILGAVLAAAPAIWVAERQIGAQRDIADAEIEQSARERRLGAIVGLVSACAEACRRFKPRFRANVR